MTLASLIEFTTFCSKKFNIWRRQPRHGAGLQGRGGQVVGAAGLRHHPAAGARRGRGRSRHGCPARRAISGGY